MSAHTTVNRPVRTSTATLPRDVIDVQLDPAEDAYTSETLVIEDTLVEEVSIDGMCGVY